MLKKITQKELDIVLEKHRLWLERKDGGERADLSYTDLSYLDFLEANLKFANFRHSNLKHVWLLGTNLEAANLLDTNLEEAFICNTNLNNIGYNKKIYQVTDVGRDNGYTYFIPESHKVICGFWNHFEGGTLEEFEKRVESVYGEDGEYPNEKYYRQYRAVIRYFEMLRDVR